jgi:hypothetical protein
MGGIISHAARTQLETPRLLYSNGKLLTEMETRKHLTTLHSQLTKHWHLLTALWSNKWRAYHPRCCCLAVSVGVMAILPTYPCSLLAPLSPKSWYIPTALYRSPEKKFYYKASRFFTPQRTVFAIYPCFDAQKLYSVFFVWFARA